MLSPPTALFGVIGRITVRMALDGDEWSDSRPRSLYPQGKNLGTPLYTRLGGPQSQSGRLGVRKNPLPPPAIENGPSSLQPYAVSTLQFIIRMCTRKWCSVLVEQDPTTTTIHTSLLKVAESCVKTSYIVFPTIWQAHVTKAKLTRCLRG
jgi:hypothetical protein